MANHRFCAVGGVVVGGKTRIPDDPAEYQFDGSGILTACSALRCGSCGEVVVHGPPGLVAKNDLRPFLKDLYGSEDWTSSEHLVTGDETHRLYFCRCTAWVENRQNVLADPDPDPMVTPDLPWGCVGHPTPTLPIALGPVSLGSSKDVPGVVDSLLSGSAPRDFGDGGKPGPFQWLTWLAAHCSGLELADVLAQELAGRLENSGDYQTTGRILSFFRVFPGAPGFDAVVGWAEKARLDICINFPISESTISPSAFATLVARLGSRETTVPRSESDRDLDDRAVALVRTALLAPLSELSHAQAGPSSQVTDYEANMRAQVEHFDETYQRLVDAYANMLKKKWADLPGQFLKNTDSVRTLDETDLEWLANHILEIESANPGRWESVLFALSFRAAIQPDLGHLVVVAVGRLAESKTVSLVDVKNWIAKQGKSTDAWVLPSSGLLEKHIG